MQCQQHHPHKPMAVTSTRVRTALIAKPGGPNTGIGRYVWMIKRGLAGTDVDVVSVRPSLPPLWPAAYRMLQRSGLDVRTFLLNYPIWASYPAADVYHLASQNLASLLLFRPPPKPVIVTVHDIIPYMLRDHPHLSSYRTVADRLFDYWAMLGLRRADLLIAVSEYTRQCLIEHLHVAPERIITIRSGVNQEVFQPLPVPEKVFQQYGLRPDRDYVIYVGSEDPRKNLQVLLRALADLRQTWPKVELIKVGDAHFDHERGRLHELSSELGIQHAVHFLNDVPDADLALLYNLARVCVLPSLYEGFGFPVLEAMACGVPAVVARATSLPELVGTAALLFEPNNVIDLRRQMEQLLGDEQLYRAMKHQGVERVRQTYSWSVIVSQLQETYT
ncbi:MAG: glycosyltransferase family 4 protein, partial [Chloroflexaceae bacterium]|nr:glycosyltransferase family 4 protein [Chloroflexaceae bacterium]